MNHSDNFFDLYSTMTDSSLGPLILTDTEDQIIENTNHYSIHNQYGGIPDTDDINDVPQSLTSSTKSEFGQVIQTLAEEHGIPPIENEDQEAKLQEAIETSKKKLDVVEKVIESKIDEIKNKQNDKLLFSNYHNVPIIDTNFTNGIDNGIENVKQIMIPKGTILYHGSLDVATFNPTNIKLGDNLLVAYFSPSIHLAADYILGCAKGNGYLHKFETKHDINLVVLDPNDRPKDNVLEFINKNYCKNDKYMGKIAGVAFIFPKNLFNSSYDNNSYNISYNNSKDNDMEFALCNPNNDLTYINTSACVTYRKLSTEYRI